MFVSSLSRTGGTAAARVVWPTLCIVSLCMGCASVGAPGEIPFGEWSGEGAFVYEGWKAAEEGQAPARESIHRRYPTSLSIRPERLDGREVIELEIRSDRGALPELGDETHLKVALVKAKRVSDSTTLYRLVGLLFNPKPDEILRFDDDAPPFGASCTTLDGTTILQIQYANNFTDTLRFRRDHVEKCGASFEQKKGLAHWWENLTRRN